MIEVKTTLYEALIEEDRILNGFFSYSYIPKKRFPGHTECFNMNALLDICEYLDDLAQVARLELATNRLEGDPSIHLKYTCP